MESICKTFPGENFFIADEETEILGSSGHKAERPEKVRLVNAFDLGESFCAQAKSEAFQKALHKYINRMEQKTRKEKMKLDSIICVSVNVPGAHHYPESVRPYLRNSHRHDFRVTVNIGVVDQNRQYEFYDVQDALILALDSIYLKMDASTYNFGTRSCEHIANDLFPVLAEKFPVESVSVFEDENNGSTVVRSNPNWKKPVFSFGQGGLV